jgi:hydroxymethylpyrimidine pyrophosphatase-like HAD family hydrolase
MDIALAIIDGLVLVEKIGETLGIDPGSPGIADYGRVIYDDQTLLRFAGSMLPNVRQKRAAIAKADTFDPACRPLDEINSEWLAALANVDIAGAVLDYDGTIVSTSERWSLPREALKIELIRLLKLGFRLGIATGRGGSAGEAIRAMIPADMLNSIIIGYYNGGHVRSAEVIIEQEPAPTDPGIQDAIAWLDANPEIFSEKAFKRQAVQITIEKTKLKSPCRFLSDFGRCAAYSDGRLKILESGHSYDIVPKASSKLAVVDALSSSLPEDCIILRLGDSGSKTGNDHALLSHAHGISVGEVCGAAEGCWSLFGSDLQGPDALLRILSSLLPVGHGKFRLDLAALSL